MQYRSWIVVFGLTAALTGCSDKGDGDSGDDGGGGSKAATIATAADAQLWAQSASAAQVLGLAGTLPLALDFIKGDCPVYSSDADNERYEGGCTDADGAVWYGVMEITHLSESEALATFEDFGVEGMPDEDCPDATGDIFYSGEVHATETSSSADYDIDLSIDVASTGGCGEEAETVNWSALYSLGYASSAAGTTFNGSGTVTLAGRGSVEASTVDETFKACGYEPDSGTTTLIAGADTVVITYDGATDCDSEATATWSLNGVEQGEITGISCATAAGSPGRLGGILAFVALAQVLRRRKR